MHEDLNWPAEPVVSQKDLFFPARLPEFLWQASPNHFKYLSLSAIQEQPQNISSVGIYLRFDI